MIIQITAQTLPQNRPGLLDGFGMCASTICVAHCVLTPILLVALPLAGFSFLENELIDRSLAVLAIFISIMAIRPGFRLHGNVKLLVLAAFGVSCLLIAAFVAEHFWGETGDKIFTMIGGTALVLTHFLNRSFCKSCLECQEENKCAA
jgi:cobalamin synthase